ncbi:heterogeneous nuclear ribonucleoprotein H isoform X2 [Asparagus officinalis]|nr:heterogeneous nuclear ribonucleoprotein H isoform X2 [Asparagus officinalis]
MTNSNPYFAVSSGISGGVPDGYDADIGSKRSRMMDPPVNPYFPGPASSFYPSFSGYGIGGGSSSIGGGSGSINTIYNFPVVRLRGLPFNCEDLDVHKFFAGLDVVDCLLVNKDGRFSGEAFVVFSSPMQAEMALERNRQNMGRRYVEVFRCKKQDYYQAIANEVTDNNGEYRRASPPPRPKKAVADEDKEKMEYTAVLKLRGLPYSTTESDIVEFFGDYELSEEKVQIARRSDGKATGEAYAEFPSAEVAKSAMCKDKMTIGSRYVELFPSTPEEARKAASRFRQ